MEECYKESVPRSSPPCLTCTDNRAHFQQGNNKVNKHRPTSHVQCYYTFKNENNQRDLRGERFLVYALYLNSSNKSKQLHGAGRRVITRFITCTRWQTLGSGAASLVQLCCASIPNLPRMVTMWWCVYRMGGSPVRCDSWCDEKILRQCTKEDLKAFHKFSHTT